MGKGQVVDFVAEECYIWECPECKENNVTLEYPHEFKNTEIACDECGHEIFVSDVDVS
jgi:DNA-directed RNA polymerase subunit RPC12/RpoP